LGEQNRLIGIVEIDGDAYLRLIQPDAGDEMPAMTT
jgi:hypothetical protein